MIPKRFFYNTITILTFTLFQYDVCLKHKVKENKLNEYKIICHNHAFEHGIQALFWPLTFVNGLIPYTLVNKK